MCVCLFWALGSVHRELSASNLQTIHITLVTSAPTSFFLFKPFLHLFTRLEEDEELKKTPKGYKNSILEVFNVVYLTLIGSDRHDRVKILNAKKEKKR